jgi:hypothetical protein
MDKTPSGGSNPLSPATESGSRVARSAFAFDACRPNEFQLSVLVRHLVAVARNCPSPPRLEPYAFRSSSRPTASAECPTLLTASESRSFDTPNLSAQYCTS